MSRSVLDLTPAELDKFARDAWSDAARQALERGLPVSGSRDGQRFRYHPDQRIEDLGPAGGMPATEQTLAEPNVDSPKLHFQGNELPEAYREMAEVRLSQATDAYQRAKAQVEAHTGLSEVTNQMVEGSSIYQLKLLDIANGNISAAFDFLQKLAGAKSHVEAMELWSAHARQQFETFTAQTKELAELTKRIGERTKANRDDKDNDSSVA